jgi:hypothetical protein
MSETRKHPCPTRQQAKILDAGDLIRDNRTSSKEAAYLERRSSIRPLEPA